MEIINHQLVKVVLRPEHTLMELGHHVVQAVDDEYKPDKNIVIMIVVLENKKQIEVVIHRHVL